MRAGRHRATTPTRIHADRAAGTLRAGVGGRPPDGLRRALTSAGCARARSVAARRACPAGWTRRRRSPPSRRGSSTSHLVGKYALAPTWGDGHHTGYYPFALLRDRCPCDECRETAAHEHGPHRIAAPGPRSPWRGSMIVSTAPFIAGHRVVETKGQTFGLVVRSRGFSATSSPASGRSSAARSTSTRAPRGHPPPGARPAGPERDADGRERGDLDALRQQRAGRDDVRDRRLRHRRRRRAGRIGHAADARRPRRARRPRSSG